MENGKKDFARQLLARLGLGRSSDTDPQGSYTGCPGCEGEKPVQDADDL